MVTNLVRGLISISIKEMYNNSITVEALVSGHPRDTKKVSVTGDGRLQECKSNDRVCRVLRNTGFCKGGHK